MSVHPTSPPQRRRKPTAERRYGVSVSMSEEESEALDRLADRLTDDCGRTISRSEAIRTAVRELSARLGMTV